MVSWGNCSTHAAPSNHESDLLDGALLARDGVVLLDGALPTTDGVGTLLDGALLAADGVGTHF